MESFPSDFARRIGVDSGSVDEVLEMLSEYVWGQVLDDGRCHIPGLGSFYMVDGKKLFEADADLARIVNHRYAGLNVLAVEETGSHVLVGADFDEPVADDFEPRWEEKPVIDRDLDDDVSIDRKITLTEDNFDGPGLGTGAAIPVGNVGSSTSNSFLDIDLDDEAGLSNTLSESGPGEVSDDAGIKSKSSEETIPSPKDDVAEDPFGEPKDETTEDAATNELSASAALEPGEAESLADIIEISDTSTVEGDVVASGTDPSSIEETEDAENPESLVVEEAESAPDDKIVIPVDENAEPVVAKGKPRASIWFYVLPILAMAFLLMAIYWAQTRQRTPRPVAQPPAVAEQTDEVSPDSEDGPGSDQSGDVAADTEPVVPAWQPGGIDVSAGGWSIIVSSKPTRAEAESIAAQIAAGLQDSQHAVDVIESTVNGQTRYRVAVGQFRTSTLTQREINRLGSQLPDGSWALPLNSNQ